MEANLPEKDETRDQKKEKRFPICQLCNKVPFW